MSRKLGFRSPIQKVSYATDSHHKSLWDFNIQCDHEIEHRRPDLLIVDKEKKTACIIDIPVHGDNRVGTKELEKILKYQDLKVEILMDVKPSGSHNSSCWCPEEIRSVLGKDWKV